MERNGTGAEGRSWDYLSTPQGRLEDAGGEEGGRTKIDGGGGEESWLG